MTLSTRAKSAFKEFRLAMIDTIDKTTKNLTAHEPPELCPYCHEMGVSKVVLSLHRVCDRKENHIYAGRVWWNVEFLRISFDIGGSSYWVGHKRKPDLDKLVPEISPIWVFDYFSKHATVNYELRRIEDIKVLEHVENALHA